MKVAIIGLGEISKLHIDALIENNHQIVALCDIVPQKCQNAIKNYNLNANVYTDYKQMIDSENLDSVHICTPHYLHAPMIIYALNKNVNVLSEKPVAISKEQLSQIEIAVQNSKAQLGVCQQNRYNDAIVYAKEYFKDKEIKSGYGSLIWRRDAEYYASGEWRGKWATEGGGVMINQALHTLDVLQWFCGMPMTVTATINNHSLKKEIEVEDTAFGMFSLSNGGNFIMTATNSAKKTFPIIMTFATDDEVMQITTDNIILNGKFITKSDGQSAIGKEVWGTGHVKLIGDFYRKVQSGEKFAIDFYEAQKVVKLILAMYSSNGKEIQIQ